MKKIITFGKYYFAEIIFTLAVLACIALIFWLEDSIGYLLAFLIFFLQIAILEIWRSRLDGWPEGWLQVYPRLNRLIWFSSALIALAVVIAYSSDDSWLSCCCLALMIFVLSVGMWYEHSRSIRHICHTLKQMTPQEIVEEKIKIEKAKQQLSKALKEEEEARDILRNSPLGA